MIRVVIMDAYADPYETFVGIGIHRRSVKRAVRLARSNLHQTIHNSGEWAGTGTPIFWEMEIIRNGHTIHRGTC